MDNTLREGWDWTSCASFVTAVILGICILVYKGVQYDRDQRRKSTIGIKDEVTFKYCFVFLIFSHVNCNAII